MSKKHLVQHKERREDAKGKELALTKKENQQLKRQLARANKQLAKALEVATDKEEATQETHNATVETRPRCGGCNSTDIKSLKMPGGTLTVCRQCGWRQKV